MLIGVTHFTAAVGHKCNFKFRGFHELFNVTSTRLTFIPFINDKWGSYQRTIRVNKWKLVKYQMHWSVNLKHRGLRQSSPSPPHKTPLTLFSALEIWTKSQTSEKGRQRKTQIKMLILTFQASGNCRFSHAIIKDLSVNEPSQRCVDGWSFEIKTPTHPQTHTHNNTPQ